MSIEIGTRVAPRFDKLTARRGVIVAVPFKASHDSVFVKWDDIEHIGGPYMEGEIRPLREDES